MVFYHYSPIPLDEILSLSAQKAEMNEKTHYKNSVSLFIKPLPSNVASLFGGIHNRYKRGTVLYECIVDSGQITDTCPWKIVESEIKRDLIYKRQRWYHGMPTTLIERNKLQIVNAESRA